MNPTEKLPKTESPATAKIMRGVIEKFTEPEINFAEDAVGRAERAKWPLVKADIIVIISDSSVAEKDRNINVSCMVPPGDLAKTVDSSIRKAISERNYQEPVVVSVRVDTAGYTAEGKEIEPGIMRQSAPAAR